MAGGAPEGPWGSAEFQSLPTGNSDRWRSLPGGWFCRVHGGLRSRLFHPVHTSTPIRPHDLEAELFKQDDPSGLLGIRKTTSPWCDAMEGIHLLRLREGNQSGGNSSGLPRIRPDVLTWSFDGDPPPPVAKQGGM